ncbi:enoyl-CoA hydratase/isomerase family protein [Nocardioides sp. TF02-7]|uniref:enoyl-CoA hydratase/isomerase family protein n=1 Tax=Nocardioides sp. TF02-7 TaxID=2917724 RepID=UPI001F058D56|nr:enoyl-CoA hydratase/isomerase family protein [Nocardioides sp. TF02-7]UMG92732.1 enoyl-CoA hydratase/isomerase family protein [Nocardioides sp. TF02-7]
MPQWTVTTQDGVAELVLSNPPRNFLTFDGLAELGTLLSELSEDAAVSVVVLRSAVDGYFVAHADLEELARLSSGPLPEARSWYATMRLIETMPQPVIAAIDGQAWGGGIELSLACTMRWASRRAHFSFIETALGIIPGAGGTQRLSRLIGRGPATDLVITGARFDATRAFELGIVSRVYEDGEFASVVRTEAAAVAKLPRTALVAAKAVLRDGMALPVSDALRLEGSTFAQLLATDESTRLQAAARQRYAAAAPGEPVRFDGLGEGGAS